MKQLLYRYGLCSVDRWDFPSFELKHRREVLKSLYGPTLPSWYPSKFGSERVLWWVSLSCLHDLLDRRVRHCKEEGCRRGRRRLESTGS
jgi:hypothetical protein